MSQVLTEQQIRIIENMAAEEKYNYFVRETVEHQKVWALKDEDGYVQLGDSGQVCLPVWPHSELASQWACDEWEGCEPVAIPMKLWVSQWLSNMARRSALLAVSPCEYEESIITEPLDIQRDTLSALSPANLI